MTDDELAQEAQRRYALLEQHFPQAAADLRELYRRGLVPGLRSLRSVTVDGVTHGQPAIPDGLPLSKICLRGPTVKEDV